jgi:ribonuclease HI
MTTLISRLAKMQGQSLQIQREPSISLLATIHADGSSLGNPGPAGIGAVVVCGSMKHEIAAPLGKTTNNVAEYTALVRGLERAIDMGAKEAEVFMDSELVVRQITGRYKIKNEGLRPLFDQAVALSKMFKKFSIKNIPSEMNAEADKLSKLGAEGKKLSESHTHEPESPKPAAKPAKPKKEKADSKGSARGSARGSSGEQGSLF